jgi:hypothetical protein
VFAKYKVKEENVRKSIYEEENTLKADSSDEALKKLTESMENT